MLFNRDSITGLILIEFKEHPVVDFGDQRDGSYDVTAEGFTDFTPDFLEDGLFSHRQYCICLIETVIEFLPGDLSGFLDYQCTLMKDSFRWLSNFELLMQQNKNHELILPHKDKLILFAELVKGQRIKLSGYVRKRKEGSIFEPGVKYQKKKKYDMDQVKEDLQKEAGYVNKKLFLIRWRTSYLQEDGTKEQDNFVEAIDLELGFLEMIKDLKGMDQSQSKYTFRGTPTQLASIFAYLDKLEDKKGNLFFDGSVTALARIISGNYYNDKGEPFSENSMRTLITGFRDGNKPNIRGKIDLDINLEDDQ